jgi:oxygen-independent coproporphyrinogen-3 oxidase
MLGTFFRKRLCKALTGVSDLALTNRVPSRQELRERFEGTDELGLYLHVPFCRKICPYCPYNKEIYDPDLAERYAVCVSREIESYADLVGSRPVTSLYVGGGTPTTMLRSGLADLLDDARKAFDLRCGVHMESHPNDLTSENLDAIQSMGVEHLSIGIEALQEEHLRFLHRPYTVAQARAAIERAVGRKFECVNVDVIFALPGQSVDDVEETARALVQMGVDQVAAYPLFRFPHTVMGADGAASNHGIGAIFRRRSMLEALERIFYEAGYRRTSVWAFTRPGVSPYCSVTVPLYVGLGASGGSYLEDIFYINTFSVAEYIKAIEGRGTAIALSLELSELMQMAGWLYWRIYETRFTRRDFRNRFNRDLDRIYGRSLATLRRLGFLKDDGERLVLTDSGAYWLHALEDLFSLEYVGRLWGRSKHEPWPDRVLLG